MATDPLAMSAATAAQHIEITPGTCGGKPRIAGHRIRVQDVVLWTESGQSADEIVADFPQLSLADVYAALAYYHDNRAQIDQDIREDREFFERMKSQAGPTLLDRLRAKNTDGGNPVSS
ncbi:MAG: DUF433 domain-containing protein [Pirellulales bacterium]